MILSEKHALRKKKITTRQAALSSGWATGSIPSPTHIAHVETPLLPLPYRSHEANTGKKRTQTFTIEARGGKNEERVPSPPPRGATTHASPAQVPGSPASSPLRAWAGSQESCKNHHRARGKPNSFFSDWNFRLLL